MRTPGMKSARLAYVVVPIEGTVKREVITCKARTKDKEGRATSVDFITKEVDQPGGYMVYCPRGHAFRLKSREQLRHYGIDKPAPVVDVGGLSDPNSPLGKLIRAQDDAERHDIMQDLEKQVIALATAKSGPITLEVSNVS